MKHIIRVLLSAGMALAVLFGGTQVSNAASASNYQTCSGNYKVTAKADGYYNLYAEVVGHESRSKWTSDTRDHIILRPGTQAALGKASAQDFNKYNLGIAVIYCS